jgi:CheY-like chemotaxis protein
MPESSEHAARPRILVIEDSADSREMLVHLLGHEGFAAIGAADGVEGLDVARNLAPDLIITDLQMPRLTGVDLIRSLRDDSVLGRTPILAMTAAGSGDAREAMEAGASAFVLKPLNVDALMVLCRALIPPNPSAPRPLVLVVDDVADTRAALRSVLEEEGYRVSEASNGQDAVIQANREAPDVVLLDLVMPEVDGFAAAQVISDDESLANTALIALSELPPDAVEKRAATSLFGAVLQKPVTPRELLDAVALLVERLAKEPPRT